MQAEHTEMLGETFCRVLEDLAFMFGEPVEKSELPRGAPGYIQAKMTFSGEMAGALSLSVPADMCPVIAANVLGMEPEDAQANEKSLDALKEVLNVVCGQILTGIAGDEPIFDLSVPETDSLSADGWKTLLGSADSVGFILEDLPVVLELKLEP